MLTESLDDIKRLAGLVTEDSHLNELLPSWDDVQKGVKSVGNAVSGAVDAGKQKMAQVGQNISKGADTVGSEIKNMTKNAGIPTGQQQAKPAPQQPKPDPIPTKPGQVMKWKNPKTGFFELYLYVKFPKTNLNRNAAAQGKKVKLGKAADQKTINFVPGEKLEGGVVVQPGTNTEIYQNLIKTHVDNAAHAQGQQTSGVASAGTTDLKDAKPWKDLSYEEKKKFYTPEDFAAAKKALFDFADRNPDFKRDLHAAIQYSQDGDPGMLRDMIIMGLEREASPQSGEAAYTASLKKSDIDTGATATNKNGKNIGTTATTDMGSGIGTTATLGSGGMGGVA